MGMFSSLIFTMWFGFGQTFARNFGCISSPNKFPSLIQQNDNTLVEWANFTYIDGCPDTIKNGFEYPEPLKM